MEIRPKSPQEQAAQAMSVYPHFSEGSMSEFQANRLTDKAKGLKKGLEDLNPYQMSDDELQSYLSGMQTEAVVSGVWRPDRGIGARDRIKYGTEKKIGFGYTAEEAVEGAMRDLSAQGYLGDLRYRRKEQEGNFKRPIIEFLGSNPIDDAAEKLEINSLLQRTVDLSTITAEERKKIGQDFPSGNFLYHGAATEQLVKILGSGSLVTVKELHERETKAAEAEGRPKDFIRRNSGYEGISWSFNEIDALPGDRYHMAGFVVAPEVALANDQQLVIPSRPAPSELLQISGDFDANEYYTAKTQFELYRNQGMMGETNSVFDNLVSISIWEKEESRQYRDEPMLYQAQSNILAIPGFEDKLRALYKVEQDGKISLDPDLLQQIDNDIPVAAVWLQAAIDTGRLKDTQFAGKNVPEIVSIINSDNMKDLLSVAQKDWKPIEDLMEAVENQTTNVEVPVEQMYFVAPRKDAALWLKVFTRMPHKPAGVLLYDDKKVRLENFATSHRGDYTELTAELRKAIESGQDTINYNDVLGTEFEDTMRGGYKHQVIAERHLANRRVIKKSADNKVSIVGQ